LTHPRAALGKHPRAAPGKSHTAIRRVNVGGLAIQNQAVEVANQISDQFVQSTGDGLLGLAWGSINTVQPTPVQTPVENMITQDDM
jgi:hypothetical protein